jgi:hypothetical protein
MRWRTGLLFASLLAGSLTSCGEVEALAVLVDVRTDYLAGVEFSGVRVTATFGESGSREGMYAATTSDDFLAGVRVAELDVPRGTTIVDVVLVTSDDEVRAQRRVIVDARDATGVTVVITRACEGIVCPTTGGDVTLTSCLAGVCVDPRCSPETPERCPEPMCDVDGECATVECNRGRCIEGTCLSVADDALCPTGEICVPERGCEPTTGLDAGRVDGGMDSTIADTGADDTGPADIGTSDASDDTRSTDTGPVDVGADTLADSGSDADAGTPPCLITDACSPYSLARVAVTSGGTVPSAQGSLGASSQIDVEWTGAELAVVWSDMRDSGMFPPEIYLAQFDRSLVRTSTDLRLTTAHGLSASPSVEWTGSEFALAWYEGGETALLFNRYDAAGTASGANVVIAPTTFGAFRTSLVPDASGNFGVSWLNEGSGTTHDALFTTIDGSGTALSSILTLETGGGTGFLRRLAHTFSGSDHGVVWGVAVFGGQRVRMNRVSAAGVARGETSLASISRFGWPPVAIAGDGTRFLVLWVETDPATLARTLEGAIVSAAGVPTPLSTLPVPVDFGSDMSLVWTGTGYALAWIVGSDIHFARLTSAGAFVPPQVTIPAVTDASTSVRLEMVSATEVAMGWIDASAADPSMGNLQVGIVTLP